MGHEDSPVFISTAEARVILGLPPRDSRIHRIIRAGAIHTRKLPGLRRELLRADVERLAREHGIPATGMTPAEEDR